MRIRTLLMTFLLIALFTLPVAAQEQTTLVVASFYPVDATAGWDGLVEAFEAANPGVTVETQVTPFNEYLAKLLS